jgi:hypothetical protein
MGHELAKFEFALLGAASTIDEDQLEVGTIEFTRSSVSAACPKLPGIDTVANFQGAWKEVPDVTRRLLGTWLHTFSITGRAWFGGNGSSGWLKLRDADGAVLFENGVLEPSASDTTMISRTGKSGVKVTFQKFDLASPDAVDPFRGVWAHITSGGERQHPRWCRKLTIKGRVWSGDLPGYGGLLAHRPFDGATLLNGSKLSLETESGSLETDTLIFSLESHRSQTVVHLRYRRTEHLENPWVTS